jgi:peptidyl-dipeptidase A
MSIDRRQFLQQAAPLVTTALVVNGPLSVKALRALSPAQEEAETFLGRYVGQWLPLETAANEASWAALVDVTEAHTAAQVRAMRKVNEFVGSPPVIETIRQLLSQKDKLDDLTARQLQKAQLRAAEAPGSVPEVVKERTEREARQSALQDGFTYTLKRPGKPDEHPSANDIDRVLISSRDLSERQLYWETSKAIGGPLRDGILRLRDLRNRVARAMGFDNFFALQVADYGMTVPEMVALCDRIVAEVKPLYAHLHTWAKHTLAKRYNAPVPESMIPAHWLPNRWGQDWPSLVAGVNMDAPFKGKPKEYIAEQAERFYRSMGFPKLPASFWTRSDLYPADPKSGRKKNSHASAWHINLRDDVRSLMSIEPDNRWFTTAHHELGHIYYDMSYSTDRIPYLLRTGANRAFHEGIGDLIGLAASQRPYLQQMGLLSPEAQRVAPVTFLLDTALDGGSVVFLPWSAGTMTHFECDFYAGIVPADELNTGWWRYVAHFQGITPPMRRPESLCDAATKTHINDDPAQYYDYAIGTLLKFQLHDHIAREILKQDLHDCNYYGSTRVGDFLRGILSLGATRDWNAVLREATGEGLTAKPLLAYFQPLLQWLERENQGRKVGWEEKG